LDIAVANALCAEGLPGAEGFCIETMCAQLDRWAAVVAQETQRHLYRVHDSRFAEHYHGSESYLRCEFLLQVLQEDCGIQYNPLRVLSPDFTHAGDQFIHGLMDGEGGGTCVSLPVLYAAVGRRLGYPIRLVLAREHMFCRWDGLDGERWNIEGTNGFSSFADEYYLNWPGVLAPSELDHREFLVSLTAREELAVFLAARGHCLFDNGRIDEALHAYQLAVERAPSFTAHQGFVDRAEKAIADRETRSTKSGAERADRPANIE
jgi:tetratricopeptide (TPR) repeat protein